MNLFEPQEPVFSQAPFDRRKDEEDEEHEKQRICAIMDQLKEFKGLVKGHRCDYCHLDIFPGFFNVQDASFKCISCIAIEKYKQTTN